LLCSTLCTGYFVLNKVPLSSSGGRRENFWDISCEKSRFYAKKSYFFQLRREVRTFLGYFVWKITILRQKIIFFPICFSTHKPTCISKVVSKYEVSLIKGFVFYRCNQQSPKLLNKGYDISNRHMKKIIHQKCLLNIHDKWIV
jgi:hypothetical protein